MASIDPTSARFPATATVQLSRNLVVQGFVIAMTALTGLTAAGLPAVVLWVLIAATLAGLEDYFLRRPGNAALRTAQVLRVVAAIIDALAALVLISHGSTAAKLYAFALMA